jgi:uncharacterized membrane protein YraQ (UPF0718 family)
MESLVSLVITSIQQVWLSLRHNWPFLVLSVVIATALKLFINTMQVSAFLARHRRAGVIAATGAAVGTPLCSCGTTAVVLGMMASTMPWAPIVAFMVASPLTSPEELVYSAGLFGWPFALAFFAASIVLGLAGGWIASVFERRGWLANQTRFAKPEPASCACSPERKLPAPASRTFALDAPHIQLSQIGMANDFRTPSLVLAADCGCGEMAVPLEQLDPACGCSDNSRQASPQVSSKPKVTLAVVTTELFTSGKRLLVMFLGFAFVGYFLNGLIPASWVAAVFGSGNVYSVPLAATLGLPLYINSEASLPLIRALLDNGMSQGAALAFMIAGAGTSIGAIAGALTIARWRVMALVIGVLWIGAMVCGFALDLALALKVF